MSFQSRALALLVLTVVILPGESRARAAEPGREERVLSAYLEECRVRIHQPEVLAMCDTLYERAARLGDEQMQLMALYARLDHFFTVDSKTQQIVEATTSVQQFCRKHAWPKFIRNYYAASSERLVPYYMRHSQANAAVYQTCAMLAEARKDDYPFAIADCYRILADTYLSQSDFRQAYDNYGLSIDQIERHSLVGIPVAIQYAQRAECALELNMPDSACLLLGKGREAALREPSAMLVMNRVELLYDVHMHDYEAAAEILGRTQKMFAERQELAPYTAELLIMQTCYYMVTGQYDRALESALTVRYDTNVQAPDRVREDIDKSLGDIYLNLGNIPLAVKYYQDYIHRVDSLRSQQSRLASNDLSGILEIVRLQNETRELQLDNQQRRLRTTYIAILSMGLVLLLVVLYSVRSMRLNRRLKNTETQVVARNEELKHKGEELMRAKEEAEKASRMKSDFIQNMSHEVRTPLNSIVGFSHVLASQFRKDASTAEYAAIIESSSLNLLRLVDDVLDVAILDRTEELPRLDYCELNTCCRECADKILLQMNSGVTMVLELSAENPVVRTNLRRVSQVLLHLLHNAAKFTVSGQIGLSYTSLSDAKLLRFTVTDTGPGIPAGARDIIFERFVKLDAFSQGTGLGLSICRVIAEKLGGSLRLDENCQFGSCFIFEVPFDTSGGEK